MHIFGPYSPTVYKDTYNIQGGTIRVTRINSHPQSPRAFCPPKENEVKVENNGLRFLKIQNFNCNSKICTLQLFVLGHLKTQPSVSPTDNNNFTELNRIYKNKISKSNAQ